MKKISENHVLKPGRNNPEKVRFSKAAYIYSFKIYIFPPRIFGETNRTEQLYVRTAICKKWMSDNASIIIGTIDSVCTSVRLKAHIYLVKKHMKCVFVLSLCINRINVISGRCQRQKERNIQFFIL